MRSLVLVALGVWTKNASRMPFVMHDALTEAVAANRSDEPFRVRVDLRRHIHLMVTVPPDVFGSPIPFIHCMNATPCRCPVIMTGARAAPIPTMTMSGWFWRLSPPKSPYRLSPDGVRIDTCRAWATLSACNSDGGGRASGQCPGRGPFTCW